jgi:hypothetical protein
LGEVLAPQHYRKISETININLHRKEVYFGSQFWRFQPIIKWLPVLGLWWGSILWWEHMLRNYSRIKLLISSLRSKKEEGGGSESLIPFGGIPQGPRTSLKASPLKVSTTSRYHHPGTQIFNSLAFGKY